jgi:hypothetical protein
VLLGHQRLGRCDWDYKRQVDATVDQGALAGALRAILSSVVDP